MPISAIAHSLALGAVDDVATHAEVLQCPHGGVVYAIDAVIRT